MTDIDDTITAEHVKKLEYFWHEKGHPARYMFYDEWAEAHPADAAELARLIDEANSAKKRVDAFLLALREKYPLPEEEVGP
jgi:hypothetical protein